MKTKLHLNSGKSAQTEDIEVNDEDTEAPVTSIPVGKKYQLLWFESGFRVRIPASQNFFFYFRTVLQTNDVGCIKLGLSLQLNLIQLGSLKFSQCKNCNHSTTFTFKSLFLFNSSESKTT